MDVDLPVTRPPSSRDVAALIGVLAVLEAEMLGAEPPDQLLPWAAPIARRLSRHGLVPPDADGRDLRQGLNDLNHRLRFALGEYEGLPPSWPVQ